MNVHMLFEITKLKKKKKISPNSPLIQSSFCLTSQDGLTVSIKLTGATSAHSEHFAIAIHFKQELRFYIYFTLYF